MYCDDTLIWVDIETTGLDPRTSKIIELGIVVTDVRAQKQLGVFQRTYHAARHEVDDWSPFIRDMHTDSGLMFECLLVPESCVFDVTEPLGFLHKVLPGLENTRLHERPLMAGSSVHFDRAFFDHHGPEMLTAFHYRNFDVSTLRSHAGFHGVDLPKTEPNHRALDDLQGTIAEYKDFQASFIDWKAGLR